VYVATYKIGYRDILNGGVAAVLLLEDACACLSPQWVTLGDPLDGNSCHVVYVESYVNAVARNMASTRNAA
jgi:hypothetical protein